MTFTEPSCSRIHTFPFRVHVPVIFFCFLNILAPLAIPPFFFVRCSFIYTFVPFSFLACISTSFLCFLQMNQITTAGTEFSDLLGNVWQADIASLRMFMLFLLRKSTTCCSSDCSSSLGASSVVSALAAALA